MCNPSGLAAKVRDQGLELPRVNIGEEQPTTNIYADEEEEQPSTYINADEVEEQPLTPLLRN